ncbi:MAG: long-chain fatty acid--CoA ligase, partial [Spirochaetales bacterium]|nr:long-chain fatty acid--CoA ligase [Spirochaetales bacterium]
EKMKTEAIEALIYPNIESQKKNFEKNGLEYTKENIEAEFNKIIDQVNRELLPYKRISRLRVLEGPMEMTTTRKIKRFKVSVD